MLGNDAESFFCELPLHFRWQHCWLNWMFILSTFSIFWLSIFHCNYLRLSAKETRSLSKALGVFIQLELCQNLSVYCWLLFVFRSPCPSRRSRPRGRPRPAGTCRSWTCRPCSGPWAGWAGWGPGSPDRPSQNPANKPEIQSPDQLEQIPGDKVQPRPGGSYWGWAQYAEWEVINVVHF